MIPRFFERVHSAVGPHLTADAATLRARLSEVLIAVECPEEGEHGRAVTAELLVNQLARLYPRLCLFGADSGVEAATNLARRINPGIDIGNDPTVATAAARFQPGGGPPSVVMSTDGWSAFIGQRVVPPARARPNSVSSAFVAGLAASALFRWTMMNDATAFEDVHVDLWAFGDAPALDAPTTDGVDLGGVAVVGVGAVGSAALWTLARIPGIRGELLLVDAEVVELSNLQRYVLAYDVDEGLPKTEMAVRGVESAAGLVTRTVREELENVELAEVLPRMLVAVDSVATRRCAQALLPEIVVNGWTSESGLGSSWHDFSAGQACMACLYHPTAAAPSQTDVVAHALGLSKERAAALWLSIDAGIGPDDIESIERKLGADPGALRAWRGKRLPDVFAEFACGAAP